MKRCTPFSSLLFVLGAVVVAGLIAIGGAYSQTAPAPGLPGYVDSRQCATCHRQIAEDYAKTGMGRSFFKPTPANTVEAYDRQNQFNHAASDTRFAMLRRGNEFFQRRWQVGFDGKEANAEELRIDYVMGSGNHARSYLHRTAAGTLIELPLGWYPGPGRAGGWGMSPGSDNDHPVTRRFISYKCMFCHNGLPQIPAGNAAPDADPVFTGEMPEGIDCQRCHGPGAEHIRVVTTAGGTPARIRASIVNPARLSPERAMDVCMQCHLETTSTRIPATLVRFDRHPFSFKPGEALGEFLLSFDHAPGTGHDDKFEVVSSAYRLRKSRCFLQSAGNMTCQTCHDPHRVPRGAAATVEYSKACRQCHDTRQGSIAAIGLLVRTGKHPSGADCITCHMPKTRAEDIPRVVMTDHLIQRKLPARNLLAELPPPSMDMYHGEVVPYYPVPFPSTGEGALYRAVAQVGLGNNTDAGLPVLAREVAAQKPANPQFYLVLGDASEAKGQHAEAVAAYEQALKLQPDSVRAMRSLATALLGAGKATRAADLLQEVIRLAPSDPEAWYRYGLLEAAAGRVPAGVAKLKKAIDLDPTLPGKSRSLAEISLQAGDLTGTAEALRDALRIDPYDEDAWDIAGRLASQKGETAEAIYNFEKSVKLRPSSATHLFDFALALARAGRMEEAQQRAEAALRLKADYAEAHDLLGGIFEQKRQLPQAAAEYRRTLELRPESARTHLRLGVVLAAQGDRSGSEEHLREAAKGRDASVAQQATQLLRQMGTSK